MLSPDCKKGNAVLKPVDSDEIICIEIPHISSTIETLKFQLLPEDESACDNKSDVINDAIQSLIMTQDINPQQMKDQLISIILPLWDKTVMFDQFGNPDRKINLITQYFKIKQMVSDHYQKVTASSVLPQEINIKQLDKNLLFMAKEFHVFGRLQQANHFYLMYLKENGFSEDSMLDYISYNLKIYDFEKVRLCCQKLMNLNESNLIGLLVQSYMNFKLNNFILCETILLKICKIAPGFIHALAILFLLQIKTEKYSLLDWISQEIMKWEKGQIYSGDQFEPNNFEFCWTPPNTCDTFFKSAIFFINLGCFEFAEMALSYNQLIQDTLKNDRYYLLSIIDFEQRNYKSSFVHFKNYRLSHQTIYKFKFNLLFMLEEYESCYNFFKNSLDDILWTLPPIETRQFYLKLAWHFVSTNKYDEAKLLLAKIPEECSTYLYWITLGKCFIGLKQLCDAEGCFINANTIDKLSSEPWSYLSDIYEELGQKSQAVICREKKFKSH